MARLSGCGDVTSIFGYPYATAAAIASPKAADFPLPRAENISSVWKTYGNIIEVINNTKFEKLLSLNEL